MFRYKICLVIFFILLVFQIHFVQAENRGLPLFGKVIYLDAGHGFRDPGALYQGVYEKDINLIITKKLEKELSRNGAIVYMTRTDDIDLSIGEYTTRKRSDLSNRVKMINESNCDLYLSIHLNAEETGIWQGIQTFYDDVNEENEKIAKFYQNKFIKKLKTTRKYKQIKDVYLNKNVTRPGILIELGFLSNGNERYLLKQNWYQDKLAKIISDTTVEYFN